MKRYLLIFVVLVFQICAIAQEFHANSSRSWKWQTRVIKVAWINPSSNNAIERSWVKDAIKQTWEKESGLIFDWVDIKDINNQEGIRIEIADSQPCTYGLGRSLGLKSKAMTLNFDFRNWIPIKGGTHAQAMNRREYFIRVMAVHEFGHAIGFAHEQARSDCYFCDEKQVGGETEGDWYISTCDLNSVMNYCNPEYCNNGKLSEKDIEGVRALYGMPKNQEYLSKDIELVSSKRNYVDADGQIYKSLVKVFLRGKDGQLQKIRSVYYRLDDSFRPNRFHSNSFENNFAFDFEMSYSHIFKVNADINFEDGTFQTITKSFNLILNKPNNRKQTENPNIVERRVACQHKVPCQHVINKEVQTTCVHRVNCQHYQTSQRLTWHTYGERNTSPNAPQHEFDLLHQFDVTKISSYEHQYDYEHEYDIVK